MSLLVPIVMFGWIPAVLLLFALLPPRRAVLAAFLGAWLFLPIAKYDLAGLPAYTKMSATCAGVLLAAFLFDVERFASFRPHWVDLPTAAWCMVPLASSLANGLGVHDGVSGVLGRTVAWGVPYFIGRLYFRSLNDLRELAVAIVISGLVYAPLCLFEIRMSPQLHAWVYGYHQHDWLQVLRFGGYRPTVFMQHGLEVSMWMTAAALTGTWLWGTGALPRLRGRRTGPLVLLLLATVVLCKSVGAALLLATGLTALFVARRLRAAWLLLVFAGLPVVYLAARIDGWSGEEMVSIASSQSQEQADSLNTRLRNEAILVDKALEQPLFGWGAWGRNRVYDDEGGDAVITDSLWILALGINGLAGLAALMATLLLPPALMALRMGPSDWHRPQPAATIAIGMLLLLYTIDCLLNAMVNPCFMLCAGGLAGTLAWLRPATAKATVVPLGYVALAGPPRRAEGVFVRE